MSGAELGLATVGTTELCLRYGDRLVTLCTDLKDAHSGVAERVIRIEGKWQRTRVQIELIQRVWNSLGSDYQAMHNAILQVLINVLILAVSKIEAVLASSLSPASSGRTSWLHRLRSMKRPNYALLKNTFDQTIRDLEGWQGVFDSLWFLLLRNPNPLIDAELERNSRLHEPSILSSAQRLRNVLWENQASKESVFLPEDSLKSVKISVLPLSSARVAQKLGRKQLLILDTIVFSERDNVPQVTAKAHELAHKMSQADPIRFGLLNCRGVVSSLDPLTAQPTSLTFVFQAAKGLAAPRSLRACLVTDDMKYTLSARLNIARELARSVSFVHVFGFVHKSVRPENILIANGNVSGLDRCFLVGFQEFCAVERRSTRSTDGLWSGNVYRHPARQVPFPDNYYVMQHDIYSLGCCLLEIGMWQSLVDYDEPGLPSPAPLLRIKPATESLDEAVAIKSQLISLARNTLPNCMGSKYASIAETCLTCLDEQNNGFGDGCSFQDEDGVLIGVRYIEKVLLQLAAVSV